MTISSYPKFIRKALDKLAQNRFDFSDDYLDTCQSILSYGEQTGNDSLTGTACFYLAQYYYNCPKSYDQFYLYLRRAILHLSNQADDITVLARCYNFLGINATDHGLTELAFDYYMQAMSCARQAESPQLKAIFEYNIGTQYDLMEQREEAIAHYHTAIDLIKICGKDDDYYFTIYSYSLCQLILAAIRSNYMVLMESSMEELNTLLANESSEKKEEFLIDPLYLEAAIAYAYKTGNDKERISLTRTLLDRLKTKTLNIDDIADVLIFAGNILEGGYPGPVKKILDILLPQVDQCDIPFIRQSLARLSIQYHKHVGDTKGEMEAFHLYYESTEQYMAETNKEYAYFLNLRNDLDELRQKNKRLLRQATTDPLTGLPNRLAFNDASEQAFDKAYIDKTTLAIEIVDIDNFKDFNDTLGHQSGDRYLCALGKLLRGMNEEGVTAFRYGGDEFVILYENKTAEEIRSIASSLKENVNKLSITADNGTLLPPMTISQGICQSTPKNKNRTWDFMYAADHALYDVKRKGKNSISFIDKLIPLPQDFRL